MPTDEQLETWCRRIKASDQDAFRAVFDELHDPLSRYAVQITGKTATAQDVVQYAFTTLWDRRRDLDPVESLEALLFRIVRNRAYNIQRNRRTRETKHDEIQQDTEPIRPNPGAEMDAARLETGLRARIDELPERQREALMLSRFQDLSHDEIAEVMGISPRTVNNHIVNALKKLRRWIRTHHEDHLTS